MVLAYYFACQINLGSIYGCKTMDILTNGISASQVLVVGVSQAELEYIKVVAFKNFKGAYRHVRSKSF